jgi:protein TonB
VKPVLLYQPWPKYPPEAVKAGVQGMVRLEAIVGEDGSVKKLKVVSGDPVLAKAATNAVSRWRYKPTVLDGMPVEIETEIFVNFKLPKRK